MSLSAPALETMHRALRDAPRMAERELLVAATEATQLVEREVKENIPRGATGLTAQSVTSDAFSTPAGVLGVVGSAMPSALWLEVGTKPHMPPVEALVPWVKAVLGIADAKEAKSVAFLVARKIKARGTAAQKPFERALQASEAQILRFYEEAAGRMAANLAGGAA